MVEDFARERCECNGYKRFTPKRRPSLPYPQKHDGAQSEDKTSERNLRNTLVWGVSTNKESVQAVMYFKKPLQAQDDLLRIWKTLVIPIQLLRKLFHIVHGEAEKFYVNFWCRDYASQRARQTLKKPW